MTASAARSPLSEVVGLFLRLGFIAFGGPAAHIALYHEEVVRRRRWLTDQEFLDLLAASNLIPGPNSTEMVIHIGFLRAGWPGLILSGAAFILPSMLMVMGLAWMYVRYQSTPALEGLMYGIKPVVIALVGQAVWSLGQKTLRGGLAWAIALAAFGLYFLGWNELGLMLAGALVMLAVGLARRPRSEGMAALLPLLPGWLGPVGLSALTTAPFSLSVLFLTFLKIGSVLYGSGYVLLAFLQTDFVDRLGWLTQQQLIDAVAIGQFTPGPVFTTATFIGYLLGGVPGGILATVGIFLPAFVFVAISNPLLPRLRRSPITASLLDGVVISSLGLMAAVAVQLARNAFIDPWTVLLGLASLVLLVRYRVNSTWLILGGGLIGLLLGRGLGG